MIGLEATWIIPAHAGNSDSAACPASVDADHPRACGELAVGQIHTTLLAGSSPRMRGTLGECFHQLTWCRIIPAHAGNSQSQHAQR